MTRPHHIVTTIVKDCVVVESESFKDFRGSFSEVFKLSDYEELGLPTHWPQDNLSISRRDVLRGLHIQRRNPQGKLVRCVQGAVFDVCLDLRRDSPTFLNWHGEFLVKDSTALYCPPGTAHGFLALEPVSIVYYKCTTPYDKDSDGGLQALDPELKINWLWPPMGVIMSEKDKNLPSLKDWLADPRGVLNG